MDGRSMLRWGSTLAASVLVHLLLLWPAMVRALAGGGSADEAVATAMPVPPAMPAEHEIAPGVDRSDAATVTWVGYEDYEEHLARRAEFEQAAFTLPHQADAPSSTARGDGGTPNAGQDAAPADAAEPAESAEPADTAESPDGESSAGPPPAIDAAEADPLESVADDAPESPDAAPPEPAPAAPGGTLDGLPSTDGRAPDAAATTEPETGTVDPPPEAPTPVERPAAAEPDPTIPPAAPAPADRALSIPEDVAESTPANAPAPASAPRVGPSERVGDLVDPGEPVPVDQDALGDAPPTPAVRPASPASSPALQLMPAYLRPDLAATARQSLASERPNATAPARPSLTELAEPVPAPPGGLAGEGERSVEGGTPSAQAGDATPRDGAVSDREAPATSRVDVPLDRIIHGRPIAREGVTITPRAIDLLVHERVGGIGRNPVARISFRRDGKPDNVVLVRPTGNPPIDQAVQSRLFSWRARGAQLDALGPDDRLTLDFRIVLNPRLRD